MHKEAPETDLNESKKQGKLVLKPEKKDEDDEEEDEEE